MSSPKITRMLGFFAPPAGCCACACSIARLAASVPTVASAVPASSMRRRLVSLRSLAFDSSLMVRSSVAPDDTPETDMAGGRIDRFGMARRRAIAPAVVGGAEMRAALQDLARNPQAVAGIAALLARAA